MWVRRKENQDHQCQTGFGGGKTGAGSANKKNNCNQCKVNREYVKEFGEKKQKGRHASAKRGARTKLQLMEDDYGFVEGI